MMESRKRWVIGTSQALLSAAVFSWVSCTPESPGAKIPGDMAMMLARVAPIPGQSVDGMTDGVIVIELFVSAEGAVKQVRVLDSPPGVVIAHLVQALSFWKFAPLGEGAKRSRSFVTKLIFRLDATTRQLTNLSDWRRATAGAFVQPRPERINRSTRSKLLASGDVILLDINERSVYRKVPRQAINIPFSELDQRREALAGPYVALGRMMSVVIDCYGPAAKECQDSAALLSSTVGVARVFIAS